jgi:hypothetical protein
MGLRLVAHFYDRIEGLIAFSAIDAAGIPVFLESGALLSVDPGYLGAVGGYRLVVCEPDLEAAVAVLQEASQNPLSEGEQLDIEFSFLHGFASFFVGAAASAPAPIRRRTWRE